MFNYEDIDHRWIWLSCVFIFLAAVFLFNQTFHYDFSHYDDFKIIGQHPQLFSTGTILERINQIVFLDYPREEPLIVRDFSWLLDSVIFGFYRPFGYHFGNVIYHALTLVLAFLLFLRLTHFGTAFVTMVMVLMLAAHIEPVAWIMGRKDILSSMFSLLSILLFLRFRESNSERKNYWVYFGSMVFALAAYLSKINAVVLPGVLFVCALINQREIVQHGFKAPDLLRTTRETIFQVIPYFVISLVVFLWYKSVQQDFGLLGKALEYTSEDYWRLIFILNPLIFLEYLNIIFFPEHLSAYYTLPSIYTEFTPAEISLALSIFALNIAAILVLWRIHRIACLFFICFLILMLPYANWLHFGFWYANRYVYFSSMFLVAAVVSTAWSLMVSRQGLGLKIAVGLVLGLVFAVNTGYRSEYIDVWRNGETLWSYDVNLPNPTIQAFNSLTSFYILQSQALPEEAAYWWGKAQATNEKALSLEWPSREHRMLSLAYFNRGQILGHTNGLAEEQLIAYLSAVQLRPDYSDARLRIGLLYYQIAREETNPQHRLQLAEEALFHLRTHFAAQVKNEQLITDWHTLLGRIKTDFPELSILEIMTTGEE